jgi:hypothetical protein
MTRYTLPALLIALAYGGLIAWGANVARANGWRFE